MSSETKQVVPPQLSVAADSSKSAAPLFQEDQSDVAIALVDASGSVTSEFAPKMSVFKKQLAIIKTLPHKKFYLRFWNSPAVTSGRNAQDDTKFYPSGTYNHPFVVERDSLDTIFNLIETSLRQTGFLTCPHLAFEDLPKEWLGKCRNVYFVTDGQIGYGAIPQRELEQLHTQLVNAITTTFGGSSRVSLYILTVELEARNYTEVNALDRAAGCDVFRLIARSNLTGLVCKFVSHTALGEFVHINKNRPPSGYIPYKEKYFSELRIAEFVQFIAKELEALNGLERPQRELKETEIAQNLSATLSYLVKDKPKSVADGIIRMFSRLFDNGQTDSQMIEFLLTEAVTRERAGKAGVFAEYRAKLNDLYAAASGMLQENVKTAINMTQQFVGHPVNGRILSGNARLVDKSMTLQGVRYSNCAYGKVPCFPMDSQLGAMNEQCLRQWVRAVYATAYQLPIKADEIMFVVLANMLIVVRSPKIPESVKNAYRRLATVMLKKKRQYVDETELARLERGDAPIPNSGRIDNLYSCLEMSAKKTGIVMPPNCNPLRLWFEMCQALSSNLADAQRKHCMVGDGDNSGEEIKLPAFESDAIPAVSSLDYECIITTDDLSASGGFRFLEHKSPTGHNCAPQCLVSKEGLDTLLASGNCICPICYVAVTRDTFAAVGPRIEFVLPKSYEERTVFEEQEADVQPQQSSQSSQSLQSGQSFQSQGRGRYKRGRYHQQRSSDQDAKDVKDVNGPNSNDSKDGKGTLVILKGTVGSGKSTMASKIKRMVEARGGTCFVEGTDKYCKTGQQPRQAVGMVTQALNKALQAGQKSKDAKDVVVVIDTCGEQTNKDQFVLFGVNFAGWKKVEIYPNYDANNIKGYLAWSLRNVLLRRRPTDQDNFYLNPESATAVTCIDVHKKKAKALGWEQHWNFAKATVDNLRDAAEAYASTLKEPVFDF